MALLTLAELRSLVDRYKDWEAAGFASAKDSVGVELSKGSPAESIFASELSKKTITYEGRDATLVLDFDDQGLLVSLELV
jgi:hypothetical protein